MGMGFLSDFPPTSTGEWEQAIRASVPGPEYSSKLIWRPEEELAVRPYYTGEDLRELCYLQAAPGEFPYVRGSRATGQWRIREQIDATVPEQANRLAIEALAVGAEEIEFSGVEAATKVDLESLLADLKHIPVRLKGVGRASAHVVLEGLCDQRHDGLISADLDPVADVAFSTELLSRVSPGLRPFTISAEEYEEKGVGAIEQIAFMLSAGVQFLDGMQESGFKIPQLTRALTFAFAIGPLFFVEIAKLRAFRLAWARVVESFGGDADSARALIFARTAYWNETVYDPHVNILRATTETLAAAIGGADSIAVSPFDECYQKPDQGGRRLARNTQLILKREAKFASVADPLGGAYLIEAMTNSIATGAWKQFQDLETAGGDRTAEADGIIAKIVETRQADRDRSIRNRRLVLTGTNRFANADEIVSDRKHPNRLARAARIFEELRFRTEKASRMGNSPKIVIAEFGDARMRRARAQFAAEFLACAGIAAEVGTYESPEEIGEIHADLVVLCSSDPEYLPFAEVLMPILRQRNSSARVGIAGNPSDAQQLLKMGVMEFIYLGCDAVAVLERIQQGLGIEH